jgi:hypothetical protein
MTAMMLCMFHKIFPVYNNIGKVSTREITWKIFYISFSLYETTIRTCPRSCVWAARV